MGRRSAAAAVAFTLLILFLQSAAVAAAPSGFDVRQHISSSTRYDVSRNITSDYFEGNPTPPQGCIPIHLNLVARHGTRAPTSKRMRQLEQFEIRLKTLLGPLLQKNETDKFVIPGWFRGWHSSWKGKFVGGELIQQGEEEMFRLGQRIGSRFPELFNEEYHPDLSPIFTTQVPRSSASAVAFGMGLYTGKGSIGPGQQRAFAVISDSRAHDIHLRFHDCCQNYKESKAARKPAVAEVQNKVYAKVAAAVSERYNVTFTTSDISSLWFLCKQEASVLEVTNQACDLFSQEEVLLLEWTDDVELHHLKGYGDSINYRMGISLLRDVKETMERAMEATKASDESNFLEKAKFRFAHAETVVPFACLLGLFLEGADAKIIQEERSIGIPPKPPLRRLWRGSLIAPFGANTMLVLYKCPDQIPGFRVQAFHNEKPVTMLACDGSHFCPIDIFMDKIVAPHLKHSFEGICFKPKKLSWRSWLLRIFGFGQKSSLHNSEL